MQLRKTFRFEASHVLPKHPGKCSRLHGHSWILHVGVEGPIDPDTGFVVDYGDISKAVKPLVEDQLDHHHLNDIGIYPTSENLLLWIGTQLELQLDWTFLAIEETCTSYARLTREEYETTK